MSQLQRAPSPAPAQVTAQSTATETRTDAQSTVGNSAVASTTATATPPSGDPAADARSALTVATAVMDGRYDRASQAPAAYSAAINDIAMVLAPPGLPGEPGMSLFESATKRLAPAADALPAEEAADVQLFNAYNAAAQKWRVILASEWAEQKAAADAAAAQCEAVSGQIGDLRMTLDRLNELLDDDRIGLGRDTVEALMEAKVVDPEDLTKPLEIVGFAAFDAWIGAAGAAIDALALVGTGKHLQDDKSVEEHLDDAKALMEGFAAVAGAGLKGASMVVGHMGDAESAKFLADGAETLGGAAFDALFAGIDLFKSGVTLCDPDASSDDKLDAIVDGAGAAVSLAAFAGETLELGGVFAAAAEFATPLGIAIPASWWVFKASMRQMTDTRIDVAQAMCVPMFEAFEGILTTLDGRWNTVVAAGVLAAQQTDPKQKAAFEAAANNAAKGMAGPIRDGMAQMAGFRSTVVKPKLQDALSLALESVGDIRSANEAMKSLADVMRWVLANARALAAQEAGLSEADLEDMAPGECEG